MPCMLNCATGNHLSVSLFNLHNDHRSRRPGADQSAAEALPSVVFIIEQAKTQQKKNYRWRFAAQEAAAVVSHGAPDGEAEQDEDLIYRTRISLLHA